MSRPLEGRFGSSFAFVHYFPNLWGGDGGGRPFRGPVIDSGPGIHSGKWPSGALLGPKWPFFKVFEVSRPLEGRFGSGFAVVHYFPNLWGDDGGGRPFRGPVIDSGSGKIRKIQENSGKIPDFFFFSELHEGFRG